MLLLLFLIFIKTRKYYSDKHNFNTRRQMQLLHLKNQIMQRASKINTLIKNAKHASKFSKEKISRILSLKLLVLSK